MTEIIDTDVHIDLPPVESLFPYLTDYWVEYFTKTADRGASPPLPVPHGKRGVSRSTFRGTQYYPTGAALTRAAQYRARGQQVFVAAEEVGAHGLGELRRHVFGQGALVSREHHEDSGAADRPRSGTTSTGGTDGQRETASAGADIARSSCLYAIDSVFNPDTAVTLSQAVNDWQLREWLEPEPRLYGSIVVPIQIPDLAVAEIERVADHPEFVQVLIPARTEHPLGSRLYHPLWQAIARHGLVAGIHFGGSPGVPPTPTGWPSTFLEIYSAMAQVFATQLTSLIMEGVFDAVPELRVSFLESGFTWLPAHLWRMDKEWKNLRRLVPWVKRPPSAYVHEHLRLGTQPLDAPHDVQQLLEVYDQLGSDQLIMYSSDYPHAHLHDARETLLDRLPLESQINVLSSNARNHYRLERRTGG